MQHGYVAEPMSQEEHDTIAQYLTICAYTPDQSIKKIFHPQQMEVISRMPGGLEEQIFIARFDPFAGQSIPQY